jgi:hypothetical protein
MKKFILFSLLASATIFGLERSVLSNQCPPLQENIKEITVLDNNAKLRVSPSDSAAKGPAILIGDKLMIRSPRNVTSCFYQVTKDNQSFWIHQSGIRELNGASSGERGLDDFNKVSKEIISIKADIQGLRSMNIVSAPEIVHLLSNLIFLFLFSSILIVGFLQRNNICAALHAINNLSTRINRFLDNIETTSNTNSDFHAQNTELTSKLLNTLDEVIPLLKQNPQIDPINHQSDDVFYQLIQILEQLQQIQHKQVQAIASLQDALNNTNQDYAKPTCNYPGTTCPTSPEPQPKPHPPSPPQLPPGIPGFSPRVIDNDFFLDVKKKFNSEDTEWLKSQINSKKLIPVTILKASVTGEFEDGEKVTKLVCSDHGEFLIFEASTIFWLIPNRTEQSWRRAVTDSFFADPDKSILEDPAEVVAIQNENVLWKVKKKGKFK